MQEDRTEDRGCTSGTSEEARGVEQGTDDMTTKELPTAELTLWKDGRAVATAKMMRTAILSGEASPVGDSLNLFFFPTIDLSPPVVFEHLAGKALSGFLEMCGLEVKVRGEPAERHEPLRYVHGRTETMKGRHRVSSVLLAKVMSPDPVDMGLWVTSLPDIYTKFLALSD